MRFAIAIVWAMATLLMACSSEPGLPPATDQVPQTQTTPFAGTATSRTTTPTSAPESPQQPAIVPTGTPSDESPTPTPEPTPTPTMEPTPTATPGPKSSADDSTSSDQRRMFNESLYASPSWASTPEYVRGFLRSRFYPLEAQYLALRALNLAVVGTFRDYLMSNPTTLSGEDWRSLFGHVRDLAESVQNPGTCGPEAAAYKLLRDHGVNILTQAVSANVPPSLVQSAQEEIYRRWLQYSVAAQGGPPNQAEFVRLEVPFWESILYAGP